MMWLRHHEYDYLDDTEFDADEPYGGGPHADSDVHIDADKWA